MTVIYIVPFKCLGIQIPIRLQVMMARELCEEKSITFTLPTTESWINQTFDLLESVLMGKDNNIIIYSHLFLASKEATRILIKSKYYCKKKKFHCSYSKESYNYDELLSQIESKCRYEKYSKKLDHVLDYIKTINWHDQSD